jgi:hypothetical protein
MGEVTYPALDGPATGDRGDIGDDDNESGSLGILGKGLILDDEPMDA